MSNNEHDITIFWGNKPTYNRHKIALEIQDACNMRAIAREFVKVVDAAMAECGSTEACWSDPAVVLLVNKLESLSRSNADDRFSVAYDACREKAPEWSPARSADPVRANRSKLFL